MNPWLKFVLAALATWRITHLLAREDGPASVLVRLRRRLGHGFLGSLMDCFHCLSFWVAAPFAFLIAAQSQEWVLLWLALSGAACLLERIGQEPFVLESLPESKEGGKNHGMLRTRPDDAQDFQLNGIRDAPEPDHIRESNST